MRVLVVDDEAEVLDVVADLLVEEGYHVTCARNGREALGVLDREGFDLVLTDLGMPYLDGLGLTRAIRRLRRPPPVVVMSADREDINLGDVPFLRKPFEVSRLLRVVARTIRNAQAGAKGRSA